MLGIGGVKSRDVGSCQVWLVVQSIVKSGSSDIQVQLRMQGEIQFSHVVVRYGDAA